MPAVRDVPCPSNWTGRHGNGPLHAKLGPVSIRKFGRIVLRTRRFASFRRPRHPGPDACDYTEAHRVCKIQNLGRVNIICVMPGR